MGPTKPRDVGAQDGRDLLPFRRGDCWGFRDADGRTVIEPAYDSAGSFADGLARVRVNGRWGYIDTRGRMVIPATFEQARVFTAGRAKVKRDGRWELIDRSGKTVDTLGSHSYVDDRGRFVSESEYRDWEKPPRNRDGKESE